MLLLCGFWIDKILSKLVGGFRTSILNSFKLDRIGNEKIFDDVFMFK